MPRCMVDSCAVGHVRTVSRLLLAVVGARAFAPILTPRFRTPQQHPWPLEGRVVFVGDQEFVVRQLGPPDAPNLVLVHGLGGSVLAEWYKVGPALARHFRVTAIDQRGHGLTPAIPGKAGIEDYAADLAGVLRVIGVDRAGFVGFSMGTAITQVVARDWPDLVDRMVLIAGFAAHRPDQAVLRRLGVLVIRGVERLTGIGAADVKATYLIATGAVERRHASWAWREAHRRNVEASTTAALSLFRFDSTTWVGDLKQPTLVVIPAHDQLVDPAWQRRLAGLLKNSKVVEVPDGKHELPWTHPDLLVGEIRAFLS